MAVLVEGISVVIKAEAITDKYPGGWEQFQQDVPNQTLCADGELARVGFMTPDDVERYVAKLEAKGLIFRAEGSAVDLAVVDQQRGFTLPCDWAEYGHVHIDEQRTQRVAACRRTGSQQRIVSYPEGWEYENSLSKDFHFVQTGDVERELEFIRKEAGVSVYRHLPTGKTVYCGSPNSKETPEKEEPADLDAMVACNLIAHAYNTLNHAFLAKQLAEDLLYTSQWVLDEMHGKEAYLDYLAKKFNSIRRTGSPVFAELATYRGRHCLVIAQGTKADPVATMLVTTAGGKISEIHMCEVPHFSECDRLGIYP